VNRKDYIEWVERAKEGDLDAFSTLVGAFQDLATGAAFGWLGDLESAKDVSQESFLDAWAHLADLRESAAFPAWLRRIVLKHCDRLTRKPAPVLELLYPASISSREIPENEASLIEEASGLRFAVARLPPHERIVVALTYFAELSGVEAAKFLELPVPTIKKRLRIARERLRAQGESLMPHSMDNWRPSRSPDFTEVVTFFLAIRQGDHDHVRHLLRGSPGLVNAVQEWDPDLVSERHLPFPSKATALITAIERDDIALLKLLLDAGADVDGKCDCPTGESSVWAATLLDRSLHLQTLLERGANPDHPSAAGTRPLHVAAMRGNRVAADLLVSHGGDPNASDRHGLTPEDWARINGHVDLARHLASQSQSQKRCEPLSSARRSVGQIGEVIFTGIKALDLFCPLPRGGLVRVPFMAGVGMVVLMGELCERITREPSGRALWTGFTQRPFDLADWRAEMSELGILNRMDHRLANFDASAEQRREAFRLGLERAIGMQQQGLHVLMVLLCERGFEADVEASFPRLLGTKAEGSITTLLITPFPERPEVTLPARAAPYSAQLRFDRSRAARGLFPAIHPSMSWSGALSAKGVGTEHVRVANAARELLESYLEEDPELLAVEKASVTDPHFASQAREVHAGSDDDRSKAISLLHYLSQPFFVAEPFTGRQGLSVSQGTLLDDLNDLLGA
jgi:RNA polymerase sigma factor (sigma-70 family)